MASHDTSRQDVNILFTLLTFIQFATLEIVFASVFEFESDRVCSSFAVA